MTLPVTLNNLVESAYQLCAASHSDNTKRSYLSAYRTYADWMEAQGLETASFKPEAVALYLTARARAGIRPASLAAYLAGIAWVYREAGLEADTTHPILVKLIRGARKVHGVQRQAKAPLPASRLAEAIASASTRDKAIILTGFLSAMRRSELVAIRLGDLTFGDRFLSISIPTSKTDQLGEGQRIVLDVNSNGLCAVAALRDWIKTAKIVDPKARVFALDSGTIARIVKKCVAKIGLDADDFAGHSLRAGFVTAAVDAGLSMPHVMAQTRHTSVDTVMGYYRRAEHNRVSYTQAMGL